MPETSDFYLEFDGTEIAFPADTPYSEVVTQAVMTARHENKNVRIMRKRVGELAVVTPKGKVIDSD